MTKTLRSLFVVCLMLCCSFVFVVSVRAMQTKAGTMYFGSEQVVTIAWDAVSGAIGYEVQLVMFDKEPVTTIAKANTSETSIQLLRPRSGQFIVKVRSWNWKVKDVEKQFSEWATSDDPTYATVDGQPSGWWISWKPASVGGGGIE